MRGDNSPLQNETLLRNGWYKIVRLINFDSFGCTYEAMDVWRRKRVSIREFFARDFSIRDKSTGSVMVTDAELGSTINSLKGNFCKTAWKLIEFNHPGIVRVMDTFADNNTYYYVMDYIEGERLDQMVDRRGVLPEQEAVRYILDVSSAVEYMHSNNMLHLDLNPFNILVNEEGKAVLTDFGASKQYRELDSKGNYIYMENLPPFAPLELLRYNNHQFNPCRRVTDIYSLGATLYYLLTGIIPGYYDNRTFSEQLPGMPANTSPGVYKAVKEAVRMNMFQRPQSVKAFMEIINDSRVTGITDGN